MVAGDEGSVFLTKDGGESWVPPEFSLNRGEWVTAAEFRADGKTGVVAGNRGSVFLTKDGGESWESPEFSLNRGERVTAAAFSAHGKTGVVAGNRGSVFLTKDGGEGWEPQESLLNNREGVTVAIVSADDEASVIYRITTSVSLERSNEEIWSIELNHGEIIDVATFSADGKTGVVANNSGSVFLTKDGGESWEPPEFSLNRGERVTAAAFSADGETGVVAGDEGSVFLTQDRGESWMSTKGEIRSSDSFSSISITEEYFVAETRNGVRYILEPRTGPRTDLTKMSISDIQKEMGKDGILKSSEIYRDIGTFLYSTDSSIGGGKNSERFLGIDDITATRIVTLFSLFFIVHVLVRLHQYSLWLATFWDARADAVLLAQSFARHSAETFDDLVAALAPDAYDFKPSPRSGHEAMMKSVDQLLRQVSRKS